MAKIKRIIAFLIIFYFALLILREIFMPGEEYLGGGYIYDSNTRAIYGKNTGQIDIPNEVVQYKYNKKYIVAKQLYLHAVDTSWFNIGNKVLKNEDSIYYWIVDKQKDTVYDPMDSITFIRFSRRLNNLPNINNNND